MSQPQYGWWSYAKHMARRWPDGLNKSEYAAVANAIAETERCTDGADRMKIVRSVLLEGTHTLEGAALTVPCSERTAQRYHADFLHSVGRHFRCKRLV